MKIITQTRETPVASRICYTHKYFNSSYLVILRHFVFKYLVNIKILPTCFLCFFFITVQCGCFAISRNFIYIFVV